ncbi:hypothetical protein [Ideonella paludis]|uniref:hypothetical protein n=1 Tax=Ideonella paludis TaxID=1233411 RepID=UPI00362B4217
MPHASSLPRRALLGLALSLLSPLGWAGPAPLATHTVQAQGSHAPRPLTAWSRPCAKPPSPRKWPARWCNWT